MDNEGRLQERPYNSSKNRIMGRYKVTEVNPEAIMLENILIWAEGQTIGKREAGGLVGPKRLERHIAEGKIRAEKRSCTQSGKWFCNRADVYRHCKDFRQH